MSLPKGFSNTYQKSNEGHVEGIGKCCKTDKRLWIGITLSVAFLLPIFTAYFGLWSVKDWVLFLWGSFITILSSGFILLLSVITYYVIKDYCDTVRGTREKKSDDISLTWGFVTGVADVIVILVLVHFWNSIWSGAV